jgi:hypothetical protein
VGVALKVEDYYYNYITTNDYRIFQRIRNGKNVGRFNLILNTRHFVAELLRSLITSQTPLMWVHKLIPISSFRSGSHHIAEKLLKVTINAKNPTPSKSKHSF